MGASQIQIANSALIKLGASRITDLSGKEKAALLISEQWNKLRDDVLSRFPWHFALKYAALSYDTTFTQYDFTYTYALPDDCICVVKAIDDVPYRIEGGYLLSNSLTMKIKYISAIEDSSYWSPAFCEVFAWRIAAEIAFAMTGSTETAANAYQMYEKVLKEARSRSSQEQTPDVRVDQDPWFEVRR